MRSSSSLLTDIAGRIAVHARADMQTPVDRLLLSTVSESDSSPDYSLASPMLVVMAQGGKQLMVGDRVFEYRAGDCLVVTANLPVTGHYIDIAPGKPALSLGLERRPSAVAALLLQMPRQPSRASGVSAVATGAADRDFLDAVARMLRLLDRPEDIAVMAPLIEQEILWRALNGPLGETMRQIGIADGDLTHISRAIAWIRDHYAEPISIDHLARLAGMSPSTLHRRFRAVTAFSPIQFQKQIRLQHAQSLLLAHPGDVASVGHAVGYDSPSQFTREYHRVFGSPPARHVAQLRG